MLLTMFSADKFTSLFCRKDVKDSPKTQCDKNEKQKIYVVYTNLKELAAVNHCKFPYPLYTQLCTTYLCTSR